MRRLLEVVLVVVLLLGVTIAWLWIVTLGGTF
jgi:hypothetical protein